MHHRRANPTTTHHRLHSYPKCQHQPADRVVRPPLGRYTKMEYVGLTVRGKRLHALLCTHDKSTLPRDVWMVLNVCTVKIIDIKKTKELRLGPIFKKEKKIQNHC